MLLAAAFVLAGCGGADPAQQDADPADGEQAASETELAVAVASFDIAVGEDQRLLAGVFTPERGLIAYGEVEFALAHLGDGTDTEAPVDQTATATFLPVPGMEPEAEAGEHPTPIEDTGSGVYSAQVDLDEPGFWGLRVTAELEDGSTVTGLQRFEVLEEHEVIDVGAQAPAVDNPTIEDVESGDVAPISLDSRAQEADADIPDEKLHRSTVAEAIEAGRPSVVTVATPVYCASRFCGPLVDVLADLADTYGDRAEFIHLEVWENFEDKQLNEAAAEFIQTETGGNEPWVFLLDADGTVIGRWDNVIDIEELTSMLDELDDGAAA